MDDSLSLRWISVAALAAAQETTTRQVYRQIDLGMPHSRIGTRIRVRLADWNEWHERHLVGVGVAK